MISCLHVTDSESATLCIELHFVEFYLCVEGSSV